MTFAAPVTLRTSPSDSSAIRVNAALTGQGSVTFAGNNAGGIYLNTSGDAVVTRDQDITFQNNVTIGSGQSPVVSTGTNGGGQIRFDGQVDGTAAGAESLQVISGSGPITVAGAVGGTRLHALTLQSADAGNTGSVTFQGSLTADTLTTFGLAYDIAFRAGGTLTDAVELRNTGTVTFGNDSGNRISFQGGVTHTAGVSTVRGTLQTSNAPINLGECTLAAGTLDPGNSSVTLFGDITSRTAAASSEIEGTLDLGNQTRNLHGRRRTCRHGPVDLGHHRRQRRADEGRLRHADAVGREPRYGPGDDRGGHATGQRLDGLGLRPVGHGHRHARRCGHGRRQCDREFGRHDHRRHRSGSRHIDGGQPDFQRRDVSGGPQRRRRGYAGRLGCDESGRDIPAAGLRPALAEPQVCAHPEHDGDQRPIQQRP